MRREDKGQLEVEGRGACARRPLYVKDRRRGSPQAN